MRIEEKGRGSAAVDLYDPLKLVEQNSRRGMRELAGRCWID